MWQNPKTNWTSGDGVKASDLNRIEGNTDHCHSLALNSITLSGRLDHRYSGINGTYIANNRLYILDSAIINGKTSWQTFITGINFSSPSGISTVRNTEFFYMFAAGSPEIQPPRLNTLFSVAGYPMMVTSSNVPTSFRINRFPATNNFVHFERVPIGEVGENIAVYIGISTGGNALTEAALFNLSLGMSLRLVQMPV